MALVVPASMRCFSETWRIKTASRSGGQSLSGVEQVVSSPTGRWVAKVSFHLLDRYDAQTDARGFIAALDGQAGTFMIGPVDWRGQPWNVDPYTGGRITPDKAARSAAVDPSFGTNPDTTGTLDFVLSQPAAMNSTSIVIQRNQGGHLKPGQYLQIGDRLYIIAALTTADPTDPSSQRAISGTIGVTIRPWTRAAYPAGTPVNFAKPQCVMRFADADQGAIEMATTPLSDLSLNLVEAF